MASLLKTNNSIIIFTSIYNCRNNIVPCIHYESYQIITNIIILDKNKINHPINNTTLGWTRFFVTCIHYIIKHTQLFSS